MPPPLLQINAHLDKLLVSWSAFHGPHHIIPTQQMDACSSRVPAPAGWPLFFNMGFSRLSKSSMRGGTWVCGCWVLSASTPQVVWLPACQIHRADWCEIEPTTNGITPLYIWCLMVMRPQSTKWASKKFTPRHKQVLGWRFWVVSKSREHFPCPLRGQTENLWIGVKLNTLRFLFHLGAESRKDGN